MMKTILLIIPDYLPVPDTLGGAIEGLVTNIVEENEKNHRADFVIISPYEKEAVIKAEKYKFTRIKYLKLPRNHQLQEKNVLGKIWRALSGRIYYLCAFLSGVRIHADAVVAEGGLYRWFGLFKMCYTDKQLFLHIHRELPAGPGFDGVFGNIIGVSDFVCERWRETSRYQQNIYSVKNAIQPDKFCRLEHLTDRRRIREIYGIREEDCLLLFCGRIIPIKGVLELVRAVNQLHMENIKLLIVGGADFSSNAQTDYVKQIREELTGQIVMTGYVPHDQTAGYYTAADVFIQPSVCEEAAPLVLLEAQASGLPVIMSDSGGGPEFVTDKTAIVVKKKNAGSDPDEAIRFSARLAEAIGFLTSHPEKRQQMGEEAQDYARKFNMERYLEEFVNIFEEAEG